MAQRPGWTSSDAVRWLPAFAWMALIFLLSAQPGLKVSSDASLDAPLRHAAHVVVYAILAVLVGHGARAVSRHSVRLAAVAAVIAFTYGVTDEIHQSLVPDRTGQVVDLAWDGIGAAIGGAILVLADRRARRERDERPG